MTVTMVGVDTFNLSWSASTTAVFEIDAGDPFGTSLVETNVQTIIRNIGTFHNLACNVITNTVTAASTLTFRKNAANGSETVSITASTTGLFQDTVNSDTVVSGDKINGQMVVGSTGTTLTLSFVRILFDPTNFSPRLGANGNTAFASASTTAFIPISGQLFSNGTEANVSYDMRTAGTFENLMVNIASNTRTTATTFGTRIAGVSGTIIASVAASTSGFFEDTMHTDAVSSGQKVNFYITTGLSTKSITITEIASDFVTSNNTFPMIGTTPTTVTYLAGATGYTPVSGNLRTEDSTEAHSQLSTGISFTASDLQILIFSNTVTAASTGRFRKNATNGNQSVSITASTTGLFEDLVNTDSVGPTDLIDISITAGASGTSLATLWAGLLGTGTASLKHYLAILGVGS